MFCLRLGKLGRMPNIAYPNHNPFTRSAAKLPGKTNNMFRNYLKIALRNLRKEKGFAAINIFGLAVGLATCLLITLYVADDRAFPGGGIQKWTFDGTTWTQVNTFTNGATTGSRGLAGVVTGNNVTLVATTTNSKLIVYVDDGSATPVGTVVATAALNTVYRGVAISPK